MSRALTERSADPDPFVQLERWLRAARSAQPAWHEAMVLATADAAGTPSARAVLLRGVDARGFVFFTDRRSRKARELAGRPRGALVFLWSALRRQVRVEGEVSTIAEEESDAYFLHRPRGHRVSAWASRQGQVIRDRALLERKAREIESRFRGRVVPRPAYWGGYRLAPDVFEFWQGRADRLHDRLRYRHQRGRWRIERLAP